jgi:predicted DNA-binding ribbon-helix-helix protein|tara:strand:+ start:538 stop:753 length:216 start_codon:yes stop_codon:yes gene_type:complete
VTSKKPPTTSIRIRNSSYAALQQQAADRGIKVVDLIDELVLGVKTRPRPEVDSNLPEFDVDGNHVSKWISR